MTRAIVAASVLMTLAVSAPAAAQGKSQDHNKNPPPSRNTLPPTAATPTTTVIGTTPFAWIDDASLIDPGAVSIAMSIVRWQGTNIGEVDVPVVDVSIGVAPRVHLTATVPRVVGSTDPAGAAGGVGTSYFSAKIAVLNDATQNLKLSVAPMLEVLGKGVLQGLTPGERRVHFGLPVSVEVDRGAARLYAGGGYFSRGIWFAGGGAGARAGRKTFVSAGYSRSWRRADAVDLGLSDGARNELTGGASYAVLPNVSVFGSIARTIATLEENGAGTTVQGGVAFFLAPTGK